MTCNQILKKTEDKCFSTNEEKAEEVINEFLKLTGLPFSLEADDNLTRMLHLKNKYGYSNEYSELFFKILEEYGYNPKSEIINALNKLGRPKALKQNIALIQSLINCPYIDDIIINGSKIRIKSKQYGIIDFSLASHYFSDDYLSSYIQNNRLIGRCHNHTIFLRAVFPAYYAITSLCPAYFGGEYYHSYTYDSDTDSIIDLCSNAVMEKDTYDFIYEPNEISVVLNSDITSELKEVKRKSNQPDERFALLKIALYKQFLTQKARQKNPDSPQILTLQK